MPKQCLIDHSRIEVVESAEDLHRYTDIGFHASMQVMDVFDRRRQTRPHPQDDIIVVVANWFYELPKYDCDSRVLIASRIEDSSQKAYNLRGTWYVDMGLFDMSLDAARDGGINEFLSRVDTTDTEFVNRIGEMYLPKSAVSQILVYEQPSSP